jgi:hypothetical protein
MPSPPEPKHYTRVGVELTVSAVYNPTGYPTARHSTGLPPTQSSAFHDCPKLSTVIVYHGRRAHSIAIDGEGTRSNERQSTFSLRPLIAANSSNPRWSMFCFARHCWILRLRRKEGK